MSAGGGGRVGAAVLLGLAGALMLLGGTTAAWVAERTTTDVAGVPIESVAVRSGTEFAPIALPLGLLGVVASLVLALPSSRVRRVLGVGLVLLGVGGAVAVAVGVVEAARLGLGLEAGVVAAGAGAAGLVAAGVLSLRPAAPPRLSARYDVDAAVDPEDAEWDLASADDDPEDP